MSAQPPNLAELYFAAAPQEKVGLKLKERLDKYEDHTLVSQINSRLKLAWQYYFGYSPEGFHATSAVTRAGDSGELASIRVNHSRALVNALLTLITNQKFVWTPRAVNIDYNSVRQTQLASSVLEYYWHVKGVETYANKAVEEAIAFTEGFVFVEWDDKLGAALPDPNNPMSTVRSGDLRFTNISSWDVIRDPTKKSWDELDWVTIRVWRNKFDLAMRHPQVAEQILKVSPDLDETAHRSADSWESDDIPVYIFFHKPSAILPFGREVYFLSDGTTLKFGNMVYENIPLHRVVPGDLIGTPYGYSAHLEILGIQELSDSIHSSIASNLSTFGVQSVAMEEGGGNQIDEFGGMRVHYYRQGGKPAEGLNLTKIPGEAFKYVEDLKKYQELLMGLNSVVRGEAQSDRMSGSALALLQSQALQQASVLSGNRVSLIQAIGTSVIDIIKKRASSPVKIAIVGKGRMNAVHEQEVKSEDLAGISSVYVQVSNPLSQTSAGAVEQANHLLMNKLITTPEQYQMVVDTGRFEPMTRATTEELTNILRENEDIAQGLPVFAMLHDNHLLHGIEHKVAVANPEARRNPKVVQAYIAHMHEHYSQYFGVPVEMVPQDPMYRDRMLVLTGQTPPPPAPMPMGPPPGPGNGPPPNPGNAPAPSGDMPGGPAKQPSMPTNPSTDQKWDSQTGGGIVNKPV